MKLTPLVALAMSLLLSSVQGQEDLSKQDSWPRFRGSSNADHSPDTALLEKWPENGPKRLWLYDKAGNGYSGFSIQGDRLYTMGTRGESTILLCLDATSGKELWAAQVGEILSNGWGDGPRSTPTLDGDHVYTVSGLGDILCHDAKTGKKVWSSRMSKFGGDVPKWGYSESLLVDGNRVICTPGGSDGAVVALDKKTGEKIWQSEGFTGPAEYSSTVAADIHGKRQYVRLLQTQVGGLDAETGKLLWSAEWPGRVAVIPTPIVHDNQIYITSGYGVGSMLVEVSDDGQAKPVWQNKVMQNHHGGVVRVGEYLYGHADRGWACQKWDDGSEVWLHRELGKGAIHYADGMLYCLEEGSGTLALVAASPEGFQQVSQFTLSPQSEIRSRRGAIWVHPVVVRGRLFLRDQEYIYCYDVRSDQG
ncbi:MAG: PQQ-binding-like beta-propeller repeat protein [Planctomycetota bacterium]